jgi:MFS superfamily sulfate permease-like transporter
LWRQDRFEFAVGAVCFLVTLLVGAIAGIVVAFVLALVNLAKRAANPAIDVLESNGDPGESLLTDAPQGSVTAPGIIVIRLAAPLFFANADVFSEATKDAVAHAGADAVHDLVIDMEAVTDVDVTGAESFGALLEWLAERDVTVSFSRVRADTLKRLRSLGLLTGQTVYPTNRAALAAVESAPAAGRGGGTRSSPTRKNRP